MLLHDPLCKLSEGLAVFSNDIVNVWPVRVRSEFISQGIQVGNGGTYCRKKAKVSLDTFPESLPAVT
jgi:hypothetical protein